MVARELVRQGDAADRHGQSLRTRVSTQRCDDGHQKGQKRQTFDGLLVVEDGGGRDRSRHEVEDEPR